MYFKCLNTWTKQVPFSLISSWYNHILKFNHKRIIKKVYKMSKLELHCIIFWISHYTINLNNVLSSLYKTRDYKCIIQWWNRLKAQLHYIIWDNLCQLIKIYYGSKPQLCYICNLIISIAVCICPKEASNWVCLLHLHCRHLQRKI